jgi:hypothetical protein
VSISRRSLFGFVAALLLWSALAVVWVGLTGNAHVCSILQTPDADGQTPELTEAEQVALTNERCGPRASLVDILVFGTGYVVIITAFVVYATRPSDKSRDDPLVPGG